MHVLAANYYAILDDRITLIEALWTMMGVAGLWLNYINYKNAQHDLAAIVALKANGDKLAVIASHTRTALIRMGINAAILFVGITACIQPPANPDKAPPVTVVGVVLTICLFIIVILTNVNAYLDKSFRRDMISRAQTRLAASALSKGTDDA